MIPTPDTAPDHRSPRLWIGVAVIVLGLILTLDSLGLVNSGLLFRLSPALLVVFGVFRIRQDQQTRGLSGYFFILAGLFLLLVNFGPERLSDSVGPLFLVFLGIFLVVKALNKTRRVPPELASHQGFLSCTAIFGGCKRKPQGSDFKGAEMTAIFGGVDLDLRSTVLEQEQVRVDVFALFGSGEIKVPQHWNVTLKATAIAGAVEDKTLHLPGELPGEGAPATARPHLVVTGLALFGGVTIVN
jgi:predicted membrane protein